MREGLTHNVILSPATLAPAAVAYQNLLRAAYGRLQELEAQVNKGLQPGMRDTRGDITQPALALSSPNGDCVKNSVDRFKRDKGLQ
jgi:hypothetical protein